MLLGAIGGTAGGLIAYVGFNGVHASTMNFASFSQVTFAFLVTPALLIQGVLYALALGFVGGLLPSVRAARLPITAGLQGVVRLRDVKTEEPVRRSQVRHARA